MGRTPKLNNDAGFAQFVRGGDAGDVGIPEFEKRVEESLRVGDRIFVEEINVAREPGITVVNDGFAADDKITDAMPREKSQKSEDVAGKRGAVYGARWHSRTSFALAG